MASTTFSGPVTSTNGFIGPVLTAPATSVTASTLTVDSTYAGEVIPLNRAAGIAVTLPAAAGTGAEYRFFIGTTITSNSTTIKVANASDIMAGTAIVANDGGATASIFETAADSDTITFDGTTTGGIKGTWVELVDVATNTWWVRITGAATGTEATPFSATV
jgi:hypothetical protein